MSRLRMADKWRVSAQCWRGAMGVLRDHKGLWRYPVYYMLGMVAMFGAMGLAGYVVGWESFTGLGLVAWIPVMMVVLLPVTFLLTMVQAAFLYGLFQAMQEGAVDHAECRRRAWAQRGPLFRFALLGSLVSGLLAIIGQVLDKLRIIPYVGQVTNIVGTLAWATASFFVIPILVVEGEEKVLSALKESTGMAREHWGKTVTAMMTVATVVMVPMLVLLVVLMVAGMGLVMGSIAAGVDLPPFVFFLVTLVPVGVMMVFAMPLSTALQAGFQAALYRFSRWDETSGAFDERVLVEPWD